MNWLSVLTADTSMGIGSIISDAPLVVKGVMLLLTVMSLYCWYIIAYKYAYVKKAVQQTDEFLDKFWREKNIEQVYQVAQQLTYSPLSAMFRAGYSELARITSEQQSGDIENIRRSLRRTQTSETTRLESMVPFLATTGASAPFIGLFGTVWGIMLTVRSMGTDSGASLSVIGPQISEALFVTAVGLVAAIPAVMAYNYFQRRIRVQRSAMETFEQDFLNIVRRHFLK